MKHHTFLHLLILALIAFGTLCGCKVPQDYCLAPYCYNSETWHEQQKNSNNELVYRAEQCEKGDAEQCCRLAIIYINGSVDATKDRVKAEQLMLKACEKGHHVCCSGAMETYAHYYSEVGNYTDAAKMLELSCGEGHIPACIELGDWHCQGKGGLHDIRMATNYFSFACDRGVTEACDKLKKIGDCKLPATEQPAETVAPELDKKYLPNQSYQP